MTIPVFVLVGGRGTRLAHLLPNIPKPMAPIGNRPFLEYQIEVLKNQGFRNIHLLTGHLAEKIESHFLDGEKFGVEIQYSRETEPLGTGGAVAQALRNVDAERVLILNGDTLFLTDLNLFFQSSTHPICIAALYSSECSRYGTLEFEAESRNVTRFVEKQTSTASGWINAGAYVIERSSYLQFAKTSAFSLETNLLPVATAKNRVGAVPCSGEFLDIGLPETFALAQTLIPGWTNSRRSDF